MEETYVKLFKKLPSSEPPRELLHAVAFGISMERARLARRAVYMNAFLFLASLILFIPAFSYFFQTYNNSASSHYISLLLSDWSLVAVYWKDFILAILQSLPVFAGAVLLAFVLMILISLRNIIINLNYSKYVFR